jgi:uncharacterized membrane protein
MLKVAFLGAIYRPACIFIVLPIFFTRLVFLIALLIFSVALLGFSIALPDLLHRQPLLANRHPLPGIRRSPSAFRVVAGHRFDSY